VVAVVMATELDAPIEADNTLGLVVGGAEGWVVVVMAPEGT